MTILERYAARSAWFGEQADAMTLRADRIADARLAVFVAGLAVGAAAWWGYVPWLALLLPGAGFVALMVLHEQTHRARDLARLGVTLYSELSARAGVGGTPPACSFEPMLAVPSPHLYASDFDLFGRGGLFELLCRARTLVGAKTLAGWLLAPALPEVVVARQTAVKELIDLHDLREALALTAGAVRQYPRMIYAAGPASPRASAWGGGCR